MKRKMIGAAAAVLMLVGGTTAVVRAADSQSTATCTPAPVVTDTEAGSQISVTCTVPKPAPVTETVTVPGPTQTVTVTATPTPTPSATPTPSSTPTPTATPSSTPSSTPTATPTTPPAAGVFPTRDSAGLPDGWVPKKTVTGSYRITTAGAVIEDLQVTNGTIIVDAPNVTLRRVKGLGTRVLNDPGTVCRNGLIIEDSEFLANGPTSDRTPEAIGAGGFTFRNSVIDGMPEGLRAGAIDLGCGPVVVDHSYVRVVSPDSCTDWHGDGLQGYGGNKVTVRTSTIYMTVRNGCYGTSPFFYPARQGNTAVDIDGLLVGGTSGYPYRDGMPGPVKNLYVADKSWVYGPVDVNCAAKTAWQASVATVDAAGQPHPVRSIACTGDGS